MAYNPFTVLPITVCDDVALPAFAQCQDTTSYTRLRSQVSGLFIVPDDATPPADWESSVDWSNAVDNTVTDDTKAKYLIGRGSFLPASQVEVNLSGGRLIEVRERTYRLSFACLNVNDGHADFGRKLQNNVRKFSVWLKTLGDRIIGGETGMRPVFVNADFPFSEGNEDREVMAIIMDFPMLNFPAMSTVGIDLSGTPIPPSNDLLNDIPSYIDDADAQANGLTSGDVYWVLPGNDAIPAGVLRKIP